MREENISNMNFKELRKEVQLLRDELAIFKRKYEDAIYNLDSDNFSKGFTVEQNNMKAQIKLSADAIKTTVSYSDLENTLSKYSTISQTAEKITSTVTAQYVKSLIDGEYVTEATMTSAIEQSSESIMSTVEANYVTGDTMTSEIKQTAGRIESSVAEVSDKVGELEAFKSSVFTQTADGFTLDGNQTTFTGVIFLTDYEYNNKFSLFYHNDSGYEEVLFHPVSNNIPLVLGDGIENVYLGSAVDGRQVATRNWVLKNCSGSGETATAVFG